MHERQSFHTVVSNVAFLELGKLADLLEVVMPRWHTVIQMAKLPIQAAEAGCTLCELKGSFRGRLGLKMALDALSPSSQAIYEMSRGEQDLIEDLKLARKVSVFFPVVSNHITDNKVSLHLQRLHISFIRPRIHSLKTGLES